MSVKKTFAEEFAALLDKALPELGVGCRPDRAALEERRCFSFQVQCPSTAVAGPLSISVAEKEITLEFLSARVQLTDSQEAVTWICELIDETIIVETWFGPDLLDRALVNVNALPSGPMKLPGVTRIVRQSWKGTHDADWDVA